MKSIAFFCAEYGIEENLSLYAGGLGILAGDIVHQAGDEGLPFIAIGLFYTDKVTRPALSGFEIVQEKSGQPILLSVEIGNELVYFQVFTRNYGSARLYLLDTHVSENSPYSRTITNHLYDQNVEVKTRQQFILGVGGVKLLRALGISPDIYHLNEGHTSFAALALAAEYLEDHPEVNSLDEALKSVQHLIVASKHTILPGAGLYLDREHLKQVVGRYIARHRIDFEVFFAIGVLKAQPNLFSTTQFLLRVASRANGVSMLHTIFEKQKHPASKLMPITNGVYVPRWRAALWPGEGIGIMSDLEIWTTRRKLRRVMIEFVRRTSGSVLNPEALTIVWARRFASYKRPSVLFNNTDRLARIISDPDRPVQFIISGNAHEADAAGLEVLNKITSYISQPKFKNKIVYVPDYSISVARELVAGADVWLNTPERGVEACGTSGMKSSLNGGLQCSTSDGWMEEVDWTDLGWLLPDNGIESTLYDTIENYVKPLFYNRNSENIPDEWVKRIRKTISMSESRFSARRMLHEYVTKLYFPQE